MMTKDAPTFPGEQREEVDDYLERVSGKRYHLHILSLPGRPLYFDIVNQAVSKLMSDKYPGFRIKKIACIFERGGDQAKWLIDQNEYLSLGKRIVADKAARKKMVADFSSAYAKFITLVRRLEKRGIDTERSDESFRELVAAYQAVWATVYVLTGPIHFSYSKYFISRYLQRYKNSSVAERAIASLTQPDHDFVKEERASLARIASRIGGRRGPRSLAAFRAATPRLYESLCRHQRSYYWINNNYQTSAYLDLSYFFHRLQEAWQDGPVKANPKITPVRGITASDRKMLALFGQAAGWQDMRKQANLTANYWFKEHLQIFSRRYHISLQDLEHSSLRELLMLLDNGSIDRRKLSSRYRGLFFISFRQRDYWLTERDCRAMSGRWLAKGLKENLGGDTFKGQTACSGMAEGRVRIIINVAKEKGRLRKGDILVTSMTRPEFVPLIKLAGAIVTQEGGVTSHAALISREFGIPCIVGVNNVLRSLHDGDLVRVDATNARLLVLSRKTPV